MFSSLKLLLSTRSSFVLINGFSSGDPSYEKVDKELSGSFLDYIRSSAGGRHFIALVVSEKSILVLGWPPIGTMTATGLVQIWR